MRRVILVLCAFSTAFCGLWLLFGRITSNLSADQSVLTVAPKVENLSYRPMEFPFRIPGTTLIAQQIVSYEGQFSESGEIREVTDVAALLIYNSGDYGIAEMEITLWAGDNKFVFYGQTIPAGARILIPEQSAKAFGPKEFTACSGWQNVDRMDWMAEGVLSLECSGMGEVGITNLTDRTLECVCFLYKNYLPEEDFYVGGYTGSYYIDIMQPNEYIQIYPSFYAYPYSRVVRLEMKNE